MIDFSGILLPLWNTCYNLECSLKEIDIQNIYYNIKQELGYNKQQLKNVNQAA